MIDYAEYANRDGTWPEWLKEFKRCQKYLEDALEYGHGGYDIEDILIAVAGGEMQLWTHDNSAAVTQVVFFPREKILNIALAGGQLEELEFLLPQALRFAEAAGCKTALVFGRRGWAKTFLKEFGFAPKFDVLSKRI